MALSTASRSLLTATIAALCVILIWSGPLRRRTEHAEGGDPLKQFQAELGRSTGRKRVELMRSFSQAYHRVLSAAQADIENRELSGGLRIATTKVLLGLIRPELALSRTRKNLDLRIEVFEGGSAMDELRFPYRHVLSYPEFCVISSCYSDLEINRSPSAELIDAWRTVLSRHYNTDDVSSVFRAYAKRRLEGMGKTVPDSRDKRVAATFDK